MFFKQKLTVSERMALHAIVLEMLNSYVNDTFTKSKARIKESNIPDVSYFPIHKLMTFNLARFGDSEGREAFADLNGEMKDTPLYALVTEIENNYRFIGGLFHLLARVQVTVGSTFIELSENDFKATLQHTYRVHRKVVDEMVTKYPYVWMLPLLAHAWVARMQTK